MDQQQQVPEDLDLGYGDFEEIHHSPLSSLPQHHQQELTRRGFSAEGAEEPTDRQYEAGSSFGDSYTGSDDSYYDDSFTSWEDGRITAHNASTPKPKKKKVAARQQKRVSQARIFVLILLALTAVGISLLVYFVAREKEENDYKDHYNVLSSQILDSTKENIETIFTALNTFCIGLTTRVLDNNEQHNWPLVTFDNFETLAEELVRNSGAIQVLYAPLIKNDTMRKAWEDYSNNHQGWVQESLHQGGRGLEVERNEKEKMLGGNRYKVRSGRPQEEQLRYPLKQPQHRHSSLLPQLQYHRRQHTYGSVRGVIPSQIHPPLPGETQSTGLSSGLLAPVWQMHPAPTNLNLINHDLFQESSFQTMAAVVQDTKQIVLSKYLEDDLNALFIDTSLGDNQTQRRIPSSLFVQPIWKAYNHVDSDDLAGFVLAWIPWDNLLVDAFRDNRNETIFAKLDSTCQPQHPFLNFAIGGGNEVDYLGQGLQNQLTTFDDGMERTMIFPVQPTDITEKTSESEKPLDRRQLQEEVKQATLSNISPQCNLRIYLYASDELYRVYITKSPGFYLMGVIFAFVIIAVAFLIYDALVERRQYRVMDMAENTGRILSSLFPTQFADKLLAEKKEKEKEAKKKIRQEKKKPKRGKEFKVEQAPKNQLKKFMDTNKKGNPGFSAISLQGIAEDSDDADESPLFLAKSKPIADLFPDTTVLFSDIAGFTAWSSVREPSHVFTLLESIYQAFDFLAQQYGIFKIETIGDCYVAVCGLPEPREDHAVAMARFSMACMTKMKNLVNQLELSLGPDTGDLTMRFGLHSGPVTAGVLRGERARFQLFGDTVNIAARMESTGERDRIQVSQATRDKLVEAGKTHWFVKRDDLVKIKGKGELQTYFLVMSHGNQRRMSMAGAERRMTMGGGRRASMGGGRRMSMGAPLSNDFSTNAGHTPLKSERNMYSCLDSTGDESTPSDHSEKEEVAELKMPTHIPKKQQRLIDWNCELLQQLLRQIIARRNSSKNAAKRVQIPGVSIRDFPKLGGISIMKLNDGRSTQPIPLDEVAEAINLPEFDPAAFRGSMTARSIELDPAVISQLRTYVAIIASKYHDNPFHNFEHASHVGMSCSKLLTRIVAPDIPSIEDDAYTDDEDSDMSSSGGDSDNDRFRVRGGAMKLIHDHTFGITSDPLTQFTVILSALIHDVDHQGVPNDVLIKEYPELAAKYQEKCVAEQRSFDVAWDLLMHDTFKMLRDTICGSQAGEMKRFRQLLVQTVLATDFFDPEISAQRKLRWEKAFGEGENEQKRMSFVNFRGMDTRNQSNRKATIVLEYIIQASDIAHTMQHWHIFRKWNEKLFQEKYNAFKKGRTDKDPSETWYREELQFFDNYVIPLAMKLKECGVFGASSDEYLNYAQQNRAEWEAKGKDLVEHTYKDVAAAS